MAKVLPLETLVTRTVVQEKHGDFLLSESWYFVSILLKTQTVKSIKIVPFALSGRDKSNP